MSQMLVSPLSFENSYKESEKIFFRMESRRSFPAVALTSNTSSLAIIGNGYDYSNVFRTQF